MPLMKVGRLVSAKCVNNEYGLFMLTVLTMLGVSAKCVDIACIDLESSVAVCRGSYSTPMI